MVTVAAAAERQELLVFVARVAARSGRPALSDQHLLALVHDTAGRVARTARDDAGRLVGLAQLVPSSESSSLEVVVDPAADADEIVPALVTALTRDAAEIHWWRSSPTADDERLATRLGVTARRRLLQMRRPLPIGQRAGVTTRSFVPGVDDDAWLAVNNRAFAGHPEQAGWTRADLAQRQAEAWFDPGGFLLHERAGRLAAFCWTKLHENTDPVLGEIYVIGVDPDFQGLGLGRALTLAGLDSIAARGVDVGMLHVDEENRAAVRLYGALGFEVHHADVAYTLPSRPSGEG